MIKKMVIVFLPLLLLPAQAVMGDDDLFAKMESGGAFGKIRANMIASCYIRNDPIPQKIDLDSLKAQFPDRVASCDCFDKELKQVSNKTIFDDSRNAYQLNMEKQKAMMTKDEAKLKDIARREKAFKPFMAIIAEKCDLK